MRERIKQVILEVAAREGIKVEEIILFGSRARGEATERSDWDVLIVIKEKLNRKARWEITRKIRTLLAKELIDVDIIIKSTTEFNKKRNIPGSIVKEAAEKGTLL